MNTPLEETADDGQHGRGGPTVDVDVVGSSSTSTSTNNAFVGARIVETIARHNNKHILKQEQQQQQASGSTTTSSPSERLRRSGIRVGDPISIRKYPINTIKLFFINGYSALLVFVLHLITLESLFSILLSVIMTIYSARLMEMDENDSLDGSNMNWVLLSFAVITPMSTSIGLAFTRREFALRLVSQVRSSLLSIYSANIYWDWDEVKYKKTTESSVKGGDDDGSKSTTAAPSPPTTEIEVSIVGGRKSRCHKIDWEEFADEVLTEVLQLCIDLTSMLTLPNVTRARHRVTSVGQREAKEINIASFKLHRRIHAHLVQLGLFCERLKQHGLLPNEATRIRQWERDATDGIEKLRIIKNYRTPQALRSFARLFSVFLPPFYAPYYGQMAKNLNSLGVAIAFSVLTSIALTALFETISQMEDPFVGSGSSRDNNKSRRKILTLDGIDVTKEFQEDFVTTLLDWRLHCFPDAKHYVFPSSSSKTTIQ